MDETPMTASRMEASVSCSKFLQIGSRAILPVVAELADLDTLLRGHNGLEGIDGLRTQVHQVVQRFAYSGRRNSSSRNDHRQPPYMLTPSDL